MEGDQGLVASGVPDLLDAGAAGDLEDGCGDTPWGVVGRGAHVHSSETNRVNLRFGGIPIRELNIIIYY